MNNKLTEVKDIEEIAQDADAGIDISEHFTGRFQAKQHIDIALPLELLKHIDAECQRQKISRQAWIKMVCSEKIQQVQTNGLSPNVKTHNQR
ncbi:MAG: hypothetical protein AB4042_06930 [Leptolyngbyaceae cyanobacterium]